MLTPTAHQPQTGLRFCFVSHPQKRPMVPINPTQNHSLGYLLTCRYLLLRMPKAAAAIAHVAAHLWP